MKKFLLSLICLLVALNIQAQQAVDMADQFRADGKIYVVVVVMSVVLLGILFYLFRLDGKISKLEKDLKADTE